MMSLMEIIVDISRSPEGALTGTVRPANNAERRHFFGVMELLACLERVIDVDASVVPGTAITKEDRP
jgi:hypothetical protein